ncbi:CD276 antigen-like [Scyliorhinus canicula]|uniref:CD276 antigen-like n=1 Tax=Scyliorhinus canicula TaxID=7830 RepID=UPI0018F437B4|nr:CD276 antigen-like [Scyliorhinus canicula]XP_038656732.1 CD276 antigen-like [Scyliorhinus canicula]
MFWVREGERQGGSTHKQPNMNIPFQRRQNLLTLLSLLCSAHTGTGQAINVAQLGQDVILGCLFKPAPIKGLIIEWTLREPELRLAYSYHGGAARPGFQHPQFQNRTALEESRLGLGVASLRLIAVSPRDEGPYLCFVRSVLWKHEEMQELQVAAPYSQPEVSCSTTPPSVNLNCSSGGGYPLSRLQWQWANGSQYPGEARNRSVAASNGTYKLHSWLEVPSGLEWQLLCEVTNARINQSVASGQMCGQGEGNTSTDRRRSNESACLNDCGQPAGRRETRARLVVIGSVLNLLLLLALLAYIQKCRPVKPTV